MQSIVVTTFSPFPSISLCLPASTPISSLSYILSPLCPPQLQSLSTYANKQVCATSTATVASLQSSSGDDSKSSSTPLYLRLNVKLHGGKGGFASQLRAQGGRMSSNKATNNDSCRDLNGRRLSTIKEAQKLATYIQAAPEREKAQKEQAQAKLEALNLEIARLSGEGAGGGGQKRRLDDHEFVEESREIVEGVKDAVKLAMMKKRRKNKEKENKSLNESASPPESAPAASSSKTADVKDAEPDIPGAVSTDTVDEAVQSETHVADGEEQEEENVEEIEAASKGKGKARNPRGRGKK